MSLVVTESTRTKAKPKNLPAGRTPAQLAAYIAAYISVTDAQSGQTVRACLIHPVLNYYRINWWEAGSNGATITRSEVRRLKTCGPRGPQLELIRAENGEADKTSS